MKEYATMTDVELWEEIKKRYGEKWTPHDIKDEKLKNEFWNRISSGRGEK